MENDIKNEIKVKTKYCGDIAIKQIKLNRIK